MLKLSETAISAGAIVGSVVCCVLAVAPRTAHASSFCSLGMACQASSGNAGACTSAIVRTNDGATFGCACQGQNPPQQSDAGCRSWGL